MKSTEFSRHFYGLGVMALAAVCIGWSRFDPGQPFPENIPHAAALSLIVGLFMLLAAGAVLWRRSAAWGSAALAGYYFFVVVIVLNGRSILAHPAVYGAYSGLAEQLAIAAAALIVYASCAVIDESHAARIVRVGQIAFGLCALLFGGAHFVYMNLTAPLVPKWLPPSQVFWGYATGAGHIAAGVAILSGVYARLAAILLTVMYASFTLLVHLPMLAADPGVYMTWAENALNLALTGCAWVVADSFHIKVDLGPR